MDPFPVPSDFSPYVAEAARLLDLELSAEYLPGVVANLERLHALAAPLLVFSFAGSEEIAPVFVP